MERKSHQEIMDQIGKAMESMEKGTSLPGMCYEEGGDRCLGLGHRRFRRPANEE